MACTKQLRQAKPLNMVQAFSFTTCHNGLFHNKIIYNISSSITIIVLQSPTNT